MCLFGSGVNFYGGPGECHHKKFVKDTGNNTQHRPDSFTSQIARRYYETTLLEMAKQKNDEKMKWKFNSVGCYERIETGSSQGKFNILIEGI